MNDSFLHLPEDKRNTIINAALKVFSKHGYKKSPMNEIAVEAGISKSLLFYYFKNKKELYLFLADYCAEVTKQFDVLAPLSTVDKVSTCITVIGMAVILLILVLIFTQKKRLSKKQTDIAKEKKKFCIRCCVLVPLLILIPLLPKLAVYPAGYGMASYRMIGLWLPYSFLIAVAVLSVMILLMIISSITRYIAVKRI